MLSLQLELHQRHTPHRWVIQFFLRGPIPCFARIILILFTSDVVRSKDNRTGKISFPRFSNCWRSPCNYCWFVGRQKSNRISLFLSSINCCFLAWKKAWGGGDWTAYPFFSRVSSYVCLSRFLPISLSSLFLQLGHVSAMPGSIFESVEQCEGWVKVLMETEKAPAWITTSSTGLHLFQPAQRQTFVMDPKVTNKPTVCIWLGGFWCLSFF